jgi:hypothetical protein
VVAQALDAFALRRVGTRVVCSDLMESGRGPKFAYRVVGNSACETAAAQACISGLLEAGGAPGGSGEQ